MSPLRTSWGSFKSLKLSCVPLKAEVEHLFQVCKQRRQGCFQLIRHVFPDLDFIHELPDLEVAVHGTRHFSLSPSRSLAAIAINTMADLVLDRITHVVGFNA